MTPGGARRARRLPLPHRRAHARARRSSILRARASRAAPSASAQLRARRATRPTPPRPAGSATTTRSCAACAGEAVADGFTQIKLKVGADLDDDVRRLRDRPRGARARRRASRVDANQRWDVADGDRLDAARWRAFDPYWIEEPTSPDDVLGHAAIRARGRARSAVATGEHVAEPRDVQAAAAGRARSTSCRSTPAGSAASTRTSRSCCWRRSSACRCARTPAASGCASSSSTWRCSTTSRSAARSTDRVIEYVDHLHEHFVDPVRRRARALPRARRARATARRCAASRSSVRLPARPGVELSLRQSQPGRLTHSG